MNRRALLLGSAALAACGPAGSQTPPAPFPMRRGVNLGNALEAPNEGEWGYRIELAHLDAIRDAGFDGVRLPVRWDAHAGATRPYTIAPAFLARVDEVVNGALQRGLKVQLDSHHYDALISAPQRHRARFLALWRQIAEHYAGTPSGLVLEPFNEPNGDYWRGGRLTELQRELLAIIRESNPERLIVLGPGNWNSIAGLRDWSPPQDAHMAVSVHYYEPHAFTHQDAEWLGDDAPRFDREWGTDDDVSEIYGHIERAARWARARGYALQLGEFGVNRAVAPGQRLAWTRAVREACDEQEIAWCAWDFAGAFPVWDRERQSMLPEMREALFAVMEDRLGEPQ